MPPKKKNHLNRTGIYYLADEHRRLSPACPRKSIHDIILLLLPRWRSMTLVEKKPYEDLAKQYKRARMLNNENVITPVIPSSEEATFLEKNSGENKFLDTYFSLDLIDLFKQDFLFVTFQIFCRTDDEDGGNYYPAEMAILKYSFFESIKQEYFTIIKPEKFPVGYTGTAIDWSRETHQIPPFDFVDANGDYAKIWREVKRVIGDSSSTEPVIIFCNAFERDQTTDLLNWLSSKEDSFSPVLFHVCSFEALVSAVLRRLGFGDFAHQSVREQLRRPVYTLQVKERCIYHDSLAIQHCARAINHGFSLFLDGFIRQRFVQSIPTHLPVEVKEKQPSQSLLHSISDHSTPSTIDSISSTFIGKEKRLVRFTQQRTSAGEKTPAANIGQVRAIGSHIFLEPTSISQQMSVLSINNKPSKILKPRVLSPIKIDCRWSIPSLYTNTGDDEDQYIMTGRGLRKTSKQSLSATSNYSDSLSLVHNVGRGRCINVIPPTPRFLV